MYSSKYKIQNKKKKKLLKSFKYTSSDGPWELNIISELDTISDYSQIDVPVDNTVKKNNPSTQHKSEHKRKDKICKQFYENQSLGKDKRMFQRKKNLYPNTAHSNN